MECLSEDQIASLRDAAPGQAPPELADYLVPRIERSHVAALSVVDSLDRVMLSHHRRMTIPLARRALEEDGLIRPQQVSRS